MRENKHKSDPGRERGGDGPGDGMESETENRLYSEHLYMDAIIVNSHNKYARQAVDRENVYFCEMP